MLFEQAGEFIVNKLRTELSAHFTYHNVNHTLDVYSAAERIALQEGIAPQQMKLLLTAAWYHDSGFLIRTDEHEEESCRIAIDSLTDFEYSTDEIDTLCALIRATKVPQLPQNHLEQILADADLDYLGREDFWPISDKLYQELLAVGTVSNKQEWNLIQVKFLENHHFFTQTAINSRQAQKDINLAAIKAQIK
ncbi:HD domain-containing protein [Mucilaginibacter polytrichastri]|uniref:HD domain-containing protein n=1 Tax=Mucilaginibacter polytrichastri TaxID=1302689 RepID=A0A1Q6A075_9SPHI|nr:HD domain-containing protein [Mucilaginibacter polytrichastri]OKS87407.1 hypothetical protein RG47T_2868 [Mucilaginibacter polytrichastri]SFS90246.1 Predicted metal-dependent phosphohydrolase, HD superfamily [Mucilaginibacter polytrichastri]